MEGGNIKIGSLDKSAVSTDDINGEPSTDEKRAKKDGNLKLENLENSTRSQLWKVVILK